MGDQGSLSKRGHIRLLLIATIVWAAFWVGGLPSYYQQYSAASMALFVVSLLVPVAGVVYVVLRGVRRGRRLNVSAWIAFYFTVPLAIYDWIYCGVFLGHGVQFLARYWYLSVYYVIPWIILPPVAVFLDRSESEESRGIGDA